MADGIWDLIRRWKG